MPLHPLWQLRQVVNGVRRIDRCNNFGNRAAGKIWCTFMSLVLWIAIHIKLILALLAYVDDTFSHDTCPHLVYYAPYDAYYPAKQVQLLLLWDEIGLPHEKPKQEFGPTLTIIGFHVDPTTMTISLADSAREALIAHIQSFLAKATGRRRRLVEWQRLIGWVNWVLNVVPLMRPALQSSYDKIAGKSQRNQPVYINRTVQHNLSWFADMFQEWPGVHLLRARVWNSSQADLAIYCDASLTGLAFWTPALALGFASGIPDGSCSSDIFWFESLAVLSALHWAAARTNPPHFLAIFTDNLNTVQMFNSLHASSPTYNSILFSAIRVLLKSPMLDLRIFHIAGERNYVADAISRQLFDVAIQHVPNLTIASFTPPQDALGATPS